MSTVCHDEPGLPEPSTARRGEHLRSLTMHRIAVRTRVGVNDNGLQAHVEYEAELRMPTIDVQTQP